MNNLPVVVAFSGGIGSGKTTISRLVATELGWKWGSFGDLVRRRAAERGLDSTERTVLQDLGEASVLESAQAFVRELLESLEWTGEEHLILDGLRHVAVLKALRILTSPSKVLTVHLSADFELREIRVQREGEARSLGELERHPVEEETVTCLSRVADLVIDTSRDESHNISIISAWLRQQL